MKKKTTFGLILFTGLSLQAFAKAGSDNDGFEFVMVLVGILLLAAGILQGIDYLKKNGKTLLHRARAFARKIGTACTHLQHHQRKSNLEVLFPTDK